MRKLGERELSLLGPDVTEELLLTHLGANTDAELLRELGLITDGNEISPSGWKVLSAYPFFGNGEGKRRPYPKMLFSFLLSLSSSLPSPFFDSPFFRKDGFVNLFPTIERKKISRMAYLVGKAMYSRNLFTKDGLVDRNRADAFMSLSLHDRMSYILASVSDSNMDDASRALSLVECILGLEKEKLPRVKKAIEAYSGIALDMDLLSQIGLIYEDENGLISSRSLEERDEMGEDTVYTLSSDYTVTYNGGRDRDIYLIAEPVTADANTTQWLISKDSVRKALDATLTSDDIIRILHEYSSYGVSDTITEQIRSWEREYNQVRIIRGTVVITEERFSSLFSLPGIKEHIIEKLGERAYLFDSASSPDWRAALESYGVVMLGTTKGPEFYFESPSYRVYDTCYPLKKYREIPRHREIRFDRTSYEKLLGEAKDTWEKVLVKSHLVFSPSGMRSYSFVDGLEYNAKKELIRDAVKDGKAIVMGDTEGNYSFCIPLKIDGDTVTTDRGEKEISKIWKVSSAPKSVVRKAEELYRENEAL